MLYDWGMKIALMLNRLAHAPSEEENTINIKRRDRHKHFISETLRSSGYDVQFIEDDQLLQEHLLSFNPDLVFPQTFRADPGASILKIQQMLEEMELPYTGSPPETCRICQNKNLADEKFKQAGIPSPEFMLVERDGKTDKKPEHLDFPLFIKPIFGGCSMGIQADNPVRTDEEYHRVLLETLSHTGQPALVEEFIDGREFTVGVLGNDPPTALPLIEFTDLIREENPLPFRLFDAKTDEVVPEGIKCPADIQDGLRKKIQAMAVAAFQALGCRDYARVDIRCDNEGNPFVLEINVHPSLLPEASLPIMAEKAGIGYPQMFDFIFQAALCRYGQ